MHSTKRRLPARAAERGAVLVRVEGVRVVCEGAALICEVEGRRVAVPYGCIEPGSSVRHAGDRGCLVVREDIARDVGLVSAA